MQPDHCRTCGAQLGALDNTGEENPECIRCWLGLKNADTRERVPVLPGQLDLFGERHAA